MAKKNKGQNISSDEADLACIKHIRELEEKRAVIAGEIKDILNEHKNAHGTPKGSIRKAVKMIDMTQEQYQAKKEVEQKAQKLVQLYAEESGQYSWLKSGSSDDASEESQAA